MGGHGEQGQGWEGTTHQNSCSVLRQHLEEECMEKGGKHQNLGSALPLSRGKGEEKAEDSGSCQVLKEQSCSYVGFKNTWTVIGAGEGKTTVSTLPEGLTKETLDC